MELVAKTVQVVSVVVGVVISVLSFNAARNDELVAREKEVAARRLEAVKPFLELRQKVYMEALKTAAVLTEPEGYYTQKELSEAKRRFRALYVAELSMVESKEVEAQMVQLAKKIDPRLRTLTDAQQAAYDLSHALRDSFVASWGIAQK
jgi:hypothetical protein